MKKANRVRKHEEFSEIIHQHNCCRGKLTSIYWLAKPEHSVRIGISVGKKNGGAVTRVRIKRQVRAICDELFATSDPYDVIIVVKPAYTPELREQIREEIREAIAKFGE